MERTFSMRLERTLIERLEQVAAAFNIPKKRLIEEALKARLDELTTRRAKTILEKTRGRWKRREPPSATVRTAREAFERA